MTSQSTNRWKSQPLKCRQVIYLQHTSNWWRSGYDDNDESDVKDADIRDADL